MSLSSIQLTQFKCFENLSLDLRGLTLLTGHNAAGKSSSIQPLLLLAQAARRGSSYNVLELNGPLVRLGTPGEVLNRQSSGKAIAFTLASSDETVSWQLEASDGAGGGSLRINSVLMSTEDGKRESLSASAMPNALRETKLGQSLGSAIYLGAERSTIRDAYPIPDVTNIHADVGRYGEFAAWWYSRFADDEIDPERRHPDEQGTTLRRQLDAYLGDLFPGAQANAEAIARTALARLTFRMTDQSDWLRPANVGFGLSYAFPLIAALLLAKRGQVFIVDSPEAHLHPLGQSRMGRVLASAAAAGLQIIAETHSDHVMNGIRLAVRDHIIDANDVALTFFSESAGPNGRISTPKIDPAGSIDHWPDGFFDQADLDIMSLSGLA